MTPATVAELLGAYVCEILLRGANADTAMQALRHEYEKASRSLTVFGCASVAATRRKRPREFDREVALSRQRSARSPITGEMMNEAIARHFPPGMAICPGNRDSAAAVLAGLLQFAFALRVGNVVKRSLLHPRSGGRRNRPVRPLRRTGGALATRPLVGTRAPLSTRPGPQGRVQCADHENHKLRW